MKCGCVGVGACFGRDGKTYDPPVPICITHDCIELAEGQPDLTSRAARCICGRVVRSSIELPFFAHRPEHPYDRYYCGCVGWD